MERVGRIKVGKRENSEENPKNPDTDHHNCPSAINALRNTRAQYVKLVIIRDENILSYSGHHLSFKN